MWVLLIRKFGALVSSAFGDFWSLAQFLWSGVAFGILSLDCCEFLLPTVYFEALRLSNFSGV